MDQKLNKFFASEDGAVTVDWVVLTAAIVGLGFAVITTVAGGTTNYATGVCGYLSAQGVTTTY